MKCLVLIPFVVALAACSPSEEAVGTAIAMTEAVRPTATPAATNTPAWTPTPSFTATPSCADQVSGAVDRIEPLFSEWDDAYQIANSTARINLSGPVSDLQAIRRQIEAVTFPDCGQWRQDRLLGYMDFIIDGFIEFMGDNEASTEFNFLLAELAATGLDTALDVTADRWSDATVHYFVDYLASGTAYVSYLSERDNPMSDQAVSNFPWVHEMALPSSGSVWITVEPGRTTGSTYCAIFVGGEFLDSQFGEEAESNCEASID